MDTREQTGTTSQHPPGPGRTAEKRILLIANETVASQPMMNRLRELAGDAGAEVFVVAPALTSSAFQMAAGDVDGAIKVAKERLEGSLETLRELGFEAAGTIGESDPGLALDDGLRRFPADEVVISTHPPERSKWLEQDVVEKARNRLKIPVTHFVVDMEQGGAVTEAEHLPPSRDDERATATSYDLPRLGRRETASVVIGIAGTIALGILAIICTGDASEEGMSFGCAVRIGLAIAAFMLTVWHVVALMFFGSTRYQGRASRLAADMLLFGIPPAIVLSLFLG